MSVGRILNFVRQTWQHELRATTRQRSVDSRSFSPHFSGFHIKEPVNSMSGSVCVCVGVVGS